MSQDNKIRIKHLFTGKHLISLHYFLSYIVVAIIAMMCTGYAYNEARRILEANIEQFSLKTMTGIRDMADAKLDEINAVVDRVSYYYMTNRVLNLENPIETSQILRLKEYADYLQNVRARSYPDFSIMVYSQKNGYVIYDGAAAKYYNYYRDVLRDNESAEYSQWFHDLSDSISPKIRPQRRIYINGVPQTVIPYIQTIPPGITSNLGAIAIFINHDEMFGSMIDILPSSYSYVLTSDGSIITTFNKDIPSLEGVSLPEGKKEGFFTQTIDGSLMIMVFAHSKWGLTFISATPVSTVMSQSRYLGTVFMFTVIVCFVLCVAVAALFVRKNAVPISAVYRMLIEHFRTPVSGSNLNYIFESVKSLLDDKVQLQEIMKRQNDEIQIAYLSRLLIGNFDTEREAQAFAEYLSPYGGQKLYVVVTLQLLCCGNYSSCENVGDLHLTKATIRQALAKVEEYVIVVDISVTQLGIVFHFSSSEPGCYLGFVENTIKELKSTLTGCHIEFRAAAGLPRNELAELHYAYREAGLALGGGDDILNWYEATKDYSQMFFYPSNIEQRITACMRGGEEEELLSLLDAVISENCERLHISESMEVLLLALMKATLFKFAKELYKDELTEFTQMISRHSQPDIIPAKYALKLLKDDFINLCKKAATRNTQHTSILRQNCLSYIDANYMNPDMSLSLVASKFNLSDSYFSQFFKKQTGENFANYITQKRLDTSKELLSKDCHTIEEIAKMVGYSTSHSFRRAFKKQFGVNPAAYVSENKLPSTLK